MTIKLRRRTLLTGGLAIAAGAYAYRRGIRYPVLSLEAPELETVLSTESYNIELQDCFRLQFEEPCQHQVLALRAFAPEPLIKVQTLTSQTIELSLNNISPEAELETSSTGIEEQIDGITRKLTLRLKAGQTELLKWRVPFAHDYTFASIGDTGGHHELAWCIERAHELGAKFLLHLGDFNYQAGDYARSIELFHNAPLPCYITIGNHDFHDSGLQYANFTNSLGPFNSVFELGKTRFLNIDTAATVWPKASGKRGRLIERLQEQDTHPHTVAFTHCPLHDPTGESTHDIGNDGERDWIISALKSLNAPSLLSGHIHIFDRSEFMGIDNIIVGQGMGHQDLLTSDIAYSQMAIGAVAVNGEVDYSFAPLNMPFDLHCHPRVEPVKQALRGMPDKAELIRRIDESCSAKA